MEKTDNYIISIGGTGARILESFVNLCAAGLGPEKVFIVLLDLDKANGNVLKTKNIIENYNKIRKDLKAFYPDNHVAFFKTDIEYLKGGLVISPETYGSKNLKGFLDYRGVGMHEEEEEEDKEDKYDGLIRLLYTQTEIEETWERGFKGRPYIGAPLMQSIFESFKTNTQWSQLMGRLKESSQNRVNIFTAGSLFGGFGAAGVPIIGKIISDYIKNKKENWPNPQNYFFGSLLAEPYFTFPLKNEKEANDSELFSVPSNFPVITKLSYKYYNPQWISENPYNSMYFIGDIKQTKVSDEFESGGALQLNDPHYIEAFGALAAIDFYNKTEKQQDTKEFLALKIKDHDKIIWDDLPIDDEKKSYLKFFIMFSAIYKSFFMNTFKDISKFKDNVKLYSWYKDILKSKLFENQEDERKLNSLNNYLSQFLYWIFKIHYNSEGGPRKVRLIDYNVLGIPESIKKSKYNPGDIKEQIKELNIPDDKLSAIFFENGKEKFIYDRIHSYMCNNKVLPDEVNNLLSGDNDKPLIKFFYILYNSTFEFCKQNFKC